MIEIEFQVVGGKEDGRAMTQQEIMGSCWVVTELGPGPHLALRSVTVPKSKPFERSHEDVNTAWVLGISLGFLGATGLYYLVLM